MLYDLLCDLERLGVLLTPKHGGFTVAPAHALNGLVPAVKEHKDAITALLDQIGEGTEAGALLDLYLGGHTAITTASDLHEAVGRLHASPVVALDLETTGLDPRTDRIRLVSLADALHTYVVDAYAIPTDALRDLVLPLFRGETLLVLHNAAFDLEFLAGIGLEPQPVRLYDTGIAEQLITNAAKMVSLRALAAAYAGLDLDKTAQKSDWSGALTDHQMRYAALDARVTYLVYEKQRQELLRRGLTRAAQIDFGAIPAVVWMRRQGVPFDLDRWYGVADEEQRKAAEALTRLDPIVNWNSPAQILKALRDAGVSLADTQYETLVMHGDHPLVAALLTYREHQKRVGTYGAGWAKYIHPTTGRIHPDWRVIGAETGRMTCSAPNLTQVPREKAYRRCFRAPEDRVLVKADYSQIELRLAALIAGDAAMLAAFANGEDLHKKTATAVTGKPVQDITKGDRQLAKALNFGLLYGMGADTLRVYAQTGYGVHLTPGDAARFREIFFATYPGLRKWHKAQAFGVTEVRTLSGRRRVVEKFTEKVNSPVQGTGADIIKRALALLYERRAELPDAAPILAVHDELVLEAPAHLGEKARAHLERAMLDAANEITGGGVPIVVEADVYADWSTTDAAKEEALERARAAMPA